jgi:hypothetical protein
MKTYESSLQQACVYWFRLAYPKYMRSLFSIPNSGIRTLTNARRMKAEGMLAGVSDLFLAVPSNRHCGIFIEMKHGKNRLTKDQADFQKMAISNNYQVATIYNFDDFKKLIENYLNY